MSALRLPAGGRTDPDARRQRALGLDDELDAILADWTGALLINLDDPTIKDQLALLDSEQRALVTAFVDPRTLPDNVDGTFVHAVRTLLSGLAKVAITTHDLRTALLSGDHRRPSTK